MIGSGRDVRVHLPINIDATCSGIQHLSGMGLDPVGGKATNLMDTGKREDLYSEVAEAVKQIVARDAASGIEAAHLWIGHVSRATVKRAVMTTPYGVTEMGIRDQLIADGHTDGVDANPSIAATYLKDKIVEALESTVVAARQIMRYMQEAARALAEKGHPLRWTTPAGMTVQQSYYRMSMREAWTLYGRVNLWDENQSLGLDPLKQAQSAAPNVIHSFDAAHLAMTVNAARERGLRHFALVHDSYGTHACDVELLGAILREQFVAIYSVDRLAEFEAGLKAYAPEVELPARPSRGDLDVTAVMSSPYFFS
jgi:DNA-directed RNA polymerase